MQIGTLATRSLPAGVRVASGERGAATSNDGAQADLYYRLHVVPIRLPALRERPEDIPLLVRHFLEREGPRLGRSVTAVAADALDEMVHYAWPGNIRELRNVIERALVMSSGDVLRLPGPLRADAAPATSHPEDSELGRVPPAELLQRKKIEWIREALERSGANQRRAAELLGMHRPALTRLIRELGLREGATPSAETLAGKGEPSQ